MPLTRDQIIQYIEAGRAQGIPDDELRAEVQKRMAAPEDPGTAALRKATGLSALSPQQKLIGDVEEVSRKVVAPTVEIGLPVATALLTKGMGVPASALLQSVAAGAANVLGQGVREPGRPVDLKQAVIPAALAGLGTLATGGVGHFLTRSGSAGAEATSEVTRRGVIGGAELAFRFDPESEARTVEAIQRFLQKPPLTAGRQEVNAIISRASARGVQIPVYPLTTRLREALNTTDPITGLARAATKEQVLAQSSLNELANRIEVEAGGADRSLPIKRFEEILSKQITKPTVKVGGKMEPTLQESEFIQALRTVKRDTIEDVAANLGSEGERFVRARIAARNEKTQLENLRKLLFTRDRAGQLHPRSGAIPAVRSIFLRADRGDDTLLNIFQRFDDVTGADVVPHLKEISLRQQLSGGDAASLAQLDGIVRSMVGLRSGIAEIARALSRSVGKSLQIGSRPIGAGLGIAGQEVQRQHMLKIQSEQEREAQQP